MALNTVAVRAEIQLGNLNIVTPHVLSFNVKKERNKKSTFSASVKVLAVELTQLGGSNVVIYAGTDGNTSKIFTGDVLQTNPSPCWEDPKYVVLNISGSDITHRLENEKYTRLQEYSKSKWALITGVNRKATKGAQFKLVNHPVINTTDGNSTTDDQIANAYQAIDFEAAAKVPSTETNDHISIKFGAVSYTV